MENLKERILGLMVLFYIPITLVYLEIVLHLYMNMDLIYSVIYILFAFFIGTVLSLILSLLPNKIRFKASLVVVFLLQFIFIVEILCKDILQEFYQVISGLSVATRNNLMDFSDVVTSSISDNLFVIILMILPLIVGVIFIKKIEIISSGLLKIRLKYLLIGIVIYAMALLSLHLPWDGELTPLKLYKLDTEVNRQVEKLGLSTMISLDIKHSIFGVERDYSYDFETEKPSEEPIVIEKNELDIDFKAMNEAATNESQKWLNEYFNIVAPTEKNDYTGMFEGYNVIFFTLEGLHGAMLDEELTPTLYKMANEGIVFNNFYTPLHFTSTSGGEFRNLTGLYPKNGFPISMTEIGDEDLLMPFTLGNQLTELDYTVKGYHANENMYGRRESHPKLGYEWIQKGSGLELERDKYGKYYWPQSDLYAMETTIDEYIEKQPFHAYYLTISGHLPYTYGANDMAEKNKEEIENSKFSEYSTYTKGYLAANLEVEKTVTYLNERLEEAGIADNTLIIMVPDHIPYFDIHIIEELTGKTYGTNSLESINEAYIDFEVYRSSLIIWSASMEEPIEVDEYASQVDILPTVSNMLGLDYDSRLMAGKDVFADCERIVIMASRSWITDMGRYNRVTCKFEPSNKCTMSEEGIEGYIKRINKIVDNRINSSVYVIEEDYYNKLIFE
ncbi:MAG TPA: LTA synthase family protein [Anaerovoracaceae bacterium]|nr:LTA synthase family protein [Anaerovoracaceae bacterium]